MKTFKFLSLSFALLGCTAFASAQSSTTTATASATIISPINITKSANLAFGNILPGANPGTVELSPLGVRNPTGGVTLPTVTGTVSAAAFVVTGPSGTSYSVTLPSSITLTSGTNTMTVSNFTSQPSANGGYLSGTNGSGSQTLTVGGTLEIAAGQAVGYYSNTTDLVVKVDTY